MFFNFFQNQEQFGILSSPTIMKGKLHFINIICCLDAHSFGRFLFCNGYDFLSVTEKVRFSEKVGIK